jgi:hypothetical protein
MSVSALQPAFAPHPQAQPAGLAASPAALRALLCAGCLAAVAAAAWLGQPAATLQADPELARLLRGMALIKAALVLAAVALLLWRFGRPLRRPAAIAYLAGAWLAAGASMLVWQLSFIPLAAPVFHAGELTLLVTAWRER